MTDGEKLRTLALWHDLRDARHGNTEHEVQDDLRRIADLLGADLAFNDSPLSLETLAWCLANREVIGALRARRWQAAIPDEVRLLIELAIQANEDGRKNWVADYLSQLSLMLAAAPKKPGGT